MWGAGAAKSEGRGAYLGFNNGKFESGLYKYETKSDDIIGGRFGYGYNIGYYNTNAKNMFDGESLYGALTVGPISTSTNYSNDGKPMGYFLGLFGKGPGIAWENGTSIGEMAPIR